MPTHEAKFRIHKGDFTQAEGRVSDFQDALKDKAAHFRYDLPVQSDGDPGTQTFRATSIIARSMGAGPNNMKALKNGLITDNLRRLIMDERKAGPKERKRRGRRERYRRHERKRLKGGPNKAVQWACQYKNKTEDPYGSNEAPWGLTQWQKDLGDPYLVGQPWCGTFVGTALMRAGVKGIDSRVAGVAGIEEMAKQASASTMSGPGNNVGGFTGWYSKGKRGDAVVLFGYGVHVGLVRRVTPLGVYTVEGNTSSGSSGSQSNGGGVFLRFRYNSEIRGFARPAYP